MELIHLSEAARIFRRSLKVRSRGFRRYKGNADEICSKIVRECFNGRYFQVSAGHFCEFYSRDFGWCIDSLLKLGWKKEVLKTLSYALEVFSKSKRTATTISPSGKPFDFPFYAPDSLAYIIRSLARANALSLVRKHKEFLNNEIGKFFRIVIDKDTGLVRKEKYFSSMKDYALRKSSCYDNVMAAVLAENAKKLGLNNPFKGFRYSKLIRDNFWTGSYFLDDLSGNKQVAGDANVFPFWLKVFSSKKMLKAAVSSMQSAGLDDPFPLRYTASRENGNFLLKELLVQNYEGNTIWTHMGPLFISLVKKIDKENFRHYRSQYKNLIEKHCNYLEVFSPKGLPYHTPFYYSDESMLWAANFLAL